MSEDVLLEQMTNKRILTAENITEIDPMIGMEGITPEQFMVG